MKDMDCAFLTPARPWPPRVPFGAFAARARALDRQSYRAGWKYRMERLKGLRVGCGGTRGVAP
jgi:hypothetical protein